MELKDAILKRRMVRHFSPQPVERETIERLLDLARRAPSAGYTQGQSFVVVTDPERKLRIAALCHEQHYLEAGFHPFISGAPVLIIPCTSEAAYHRRYQEADKVGDDGSEIEWPVPYWFMDIGCSVMALLLAVVDESLAAGFAGAHDLDALRGELGLPPEITPVGVIPVGHPAPDRPSPSLKRGRRPLETVVHWEQYST
jgi:nitroreductase